MQLLKLLSHLMSTARVDGGAQATAAVHLFDGAALWSAAMQM
jgi:hypothetical protein